MPASESQVQAELLGVLAGLGWSVVSRSAMNDLRGRARVNEAIVEPLLVEAIMKLNPGLEDDEAQQIAAQVRRISSDREMLQALRSGIPYKPAPNVDTRDITILDLEHSERNSFLATEEFVIATGGARSPRLDVVCLVNGIPLGVIENKAMTEPLEKAADDWRGYWQDVPQLVAQTSVVGCNNGAEFQIGPSGLTSLDGYIDWADPWPRTVTDAGDPMLVVLAGAYAPQALLDLAVNFVVFETREGRTTKKLARAHQYRAATKLVGRVVDGTLDRGIVWHATGSGKSLTMVFAARKLLRAGLGNPTVLIVIDRTELDEQISETLLACEFDGVRRATTQADLRRLLEAGGGGVIVTMVHKFNDEMADALAAENAIVFVDEAHRTQFKSFGMWMRSALPAASIFAFTGTPIELDGRSTRRWFSPQLANGEHEAYLDRYGFDQAIADGATLKVVYEPRLSEWRLATTDIDEIFDRVASHLDGEHRERIRSDAARRAVVAKAPARVEAVAADVASQLLDRIAPNGLGAQLVATDRAACALYAEALSAHLRPDEFAVIMSRAKKDSNIRAGELDLRAWYPAARWQHLHGRLPNGTTREGDGDGDVGEEFVTASDRTAIKDFVARFKDPDDPLKLLIVNSMLITGFDAPIEQALFLDRALRGHSLIQAIARTNRRYPKKDHGLILDYWGVFDALKEALREFASDDLTGLAEDTEHLYARFPVVLEEALDITAGAPAGMSERRLGIWVCDRLKGDPEEAEAFGRLVREAESIFETLAPDPRLVPHVGRYREVLRLWLSYQETVRRDATGIGDLRAKTIALVQEAIAVDRIRDDIPPLTIDADYLRALDDDDELSPEEKATDIEVAIVHEITVRGEDDPLARTLSERLRRLRAREEQAAQMAFADLRELAKDYLEARGEGSARGLSPASAVAWQVLRREIADVDPEALLPVACGIGDRFAEIAGFAGWTTRPDVLRGLRQAIIGALAGEALTRPLAAQPRAVEDILAALVADTP
ncbi:MAG: type I restriction endonuclease subunit R [Dehalococcoidia bacterium]